MRMMVTILTCLVDDDTDVLGYAKGRSARPNCGLEDWWESKQSVGHAKTTTPPPPKWPGPSSSSIIIIFMTIITTTTKPPPPKWPGWTKFWPNLWSFAFFLGLYSKRRYHTSFHEKIYHTWAKHVKFMKSPYNFKIFDLLISLYITCI